MTKKKVSKKRPARKARVFEATIGFGYAWLNEEGVVCSTQAGANGDLHRSPVDVERSDVFVCPTPEKARANAEISQPDGILCRVDLTFTELTARLEHEVLTARALEKLDPAEAEALKKHFQESR